MYYALLFVAAVLFSGQFLFTKTFQKYNGDSLKTTLKLTFFAYITIALFFFIKAQIGADGLRFGFSWFTLAMTLGIAVISTSCVYLGVKVLGIGNTSVYSTFMMVGSMALPSLVGILAYGETEKLALKLIAIALMLAATVFTTGDNNTKSNRKAIFYYIGVFILNGLIGVLFTVHQNQPLWSAYYELVDGTAVSNSDVFMSWYGISTAILSGVLLLVFKVLEKKTGGKPTFEETENLPQTEQRVGAGMRGVFLPSLLVAIGYGIFNGMGNYFIAISTIKVGASVTFPIVNGGTILTSTLFGLLLYKEKATWKTWVGCALVLIATILFAFAQPA